MTAAGDGTNTGNVPGDGDGADVGRGAADASAGRTQPDASGREAIPDASSDGAAGPVPGDGAVADGAADAMPPEPCKGRMLFEDDFDDGARAADWYELVAEGLGLDERGGRLVVDFAETTPAASYAGYAMRDVRLRERCATVAVPETPRAVLGAGAFLRFWDGDRSGPEIIVDAEAVQMRRWTEGTPAVVASVPRERGGEVRAWRIRERDGQTRWETSDDDGRYRVRHVADTWYDAGDTEVVVGAGAAARVTEAGRAAFDDFRLVAR